MYVKLASKLGFHLIWCAVADEADVPHHQRLDAKEAVGDFLMGRLDLEGTIAQIEERVPSTRNPQILHRILAITSPGLDGEAKADKDGTTT